MNLLALDVGSSSVKSGILRKGRIVGRIVRSVFPTHFEDTRVEVDPAAVLKAIAGAIRQLGAAAKKADAIGLTVMSPSWIAMDRRGKGLTPIITHQDRRSVEVAKELEQRIGKDRYLQIVGCRPFPGGISATTFAWFLKHERSVMKRANLVGHLNTFLHRQMTSARVTDPSNASFMGLYNSLTLGGWNDELCEAVGASPDLLPEIREANEIGGTITPKASRRFGLRQGTPMMVGIMDGSAAMLLAGAQPGQLVNTCGSTDVLGVCTVKPQPHERLLTRALGIGRLWMAVSTIAAAGSSLTWAKQQLFADLSTEEFRNLMARLAAKPLKSHVRFEPYLAGERTSIDQRQGAFTGLTLSTTREEMLGAIIEALAAASAERIPLLQQTSGKMLRKVIVTGGVEGSLDKVLHRDWPGKWSFHVENEATLRSIGSIEIGKHLSYP